MEAAPTKGPVDDVCFTFRKIEVENRDGKTSYADDWTATP